MRLDGSTPLSSEFWHQLQRFVDPSELFGRGVFERCCRGVHGVQPGDGSPCLLLLSNTLLFCHR